MLILQTSRAELSNELHTLTRHALRSSLDESCLWLNKLAQFGPVKRYGTGIVLLRWRPVLPASLTRASPAPPIYLLRPRKLF